MRRVRRVRRNVQRAGRKYSVYRVLARRSAPHAPRVALDCEHRDKSDKKSIYYKNHGADFIIILIGNIGPLQRLAKEVQISSSALCRWENCQADIRGSQLVILTKYFGVTIDYLMGLEN